MEFACAKQSMVDYVDFCVPWHSDDNDAAGIGGDEFGRLWWCCHAVVPAPYIRDGHRILNVKGFPASSILCAEYANTSASD